MRNTGPIKVTKLHPLFGAEVSGIDITRPLLSARVRADPRRVRGTFRAAVPRPADGRRQADRPSAKISARSRRPRSANPAAGTKFQRQSNLDIMTGEPIPPDDMRMIYQKANYFWHSDSSFKRVPSLCSILTARICPPEGGNTEFLCMRAAWDALPPALQATIHPLVAEHALVHSRDRVQKGILSAKALAELPPVKQRMFRDNPINGRRALYIGAHAGHRRLARADRKALLYELSAARRAAGVPAVACLARRRRDRLGQPRRPASRHLLRHGRSTSASCSARPSAATRLTVAQ